MEPQNQEELQTIILNDFPTPIAIAFQRMQHGESWQARTTWAIHVFEYTLRSLSLIAVSQYLIRDHDHTFADPSLDQLLLKQMSRQNFGTWVEILFRILKLYANRKRSLFVPEMAKLNEIRKFFNALVEKRNKLVHGIHPITETEWQKEFQITYTDVIRILDQITFLRNYELISIGHIDDNQYDYRRYRGLHIVSASEKMLPQNEIKANYLYLNVVKKQRSGMLQLYPYFILYEEDSDTEQPGIQADAAILDTFTETQIHYLAAILWKMFSRSDDELRAYFDFYFYNRLTGSKKATRVHSLTWDKIKEVLLDISNNRMGTAIEKHNPELYLERDSIKAVFQEFLDSPKTCLVITGKSGVGKSNFIIATAMIMERDPKHLVLLLNGAKILKDFSIKELIRKEFTERLRGEFDAWGEIVNILENGGRKLIIFIDALNENPDAFQVLRSIDHQIEDNPYSWLKIVITSRPEAWKTISPPANLTTHKYFWQTEKSDLGVELEEFSSQDPHSMKPFFQDELEQVYKKYKRVYHLSTEYKDILPEIKQELRDPLMLLLVASTHGSKDGSKAGIIPEALSVSKIYDQYIDALKVSHRLSDADINFLRNDIVPRMLSGEPKPLLAQDDFQSDERFRERIFSEDQFNGQPINASFVRLVDAEILASLPITGPASVGFKYERFYDHFVGEYFSRKNLQSDSKLDFYKDLIPQIRSHPFLWGGVRNALFMELQTGSEELIDILASEQDQAVRELVISVLSEMGREPNGKIRVESIAHRLLTIERPNPGFIPNIRTKLTGTDSQSLTPAARSASRTALEVARRLGLSAVLKTAALHTSPSIRILAARNIYHLWRSDPEEGFAILANIVDQATDGIGLPNIPAVETSLALIILMLRHYYPDTADGQELGRHLLTQIQKIVRRVFFVSNRGGVWGQLVVLPIRNLVINAVVRFIVKTQEDYPEDKPSFLNEVADLINAPDDVKARYDRLINYFEKPGGLDKIREDIHEAVIYNDTLTNGVVWLIIVSDYLSGRETDYSKIEEPSSLELSQHYVGSTNEGMIVAIGLLSSAKKETGDDLFNQLHRMTINYISKTKGFYYSRSGTRHPNLALNPYMSMRRLRQNPTDQDLAAFFLEKAIADRDLTFFNMLIDSLISQVSSDDLVNCRMTLQSLRVAFPLQQHFEEKDLGKIEEKIITALAIMRLYNRDEVDSFLLDIDSENRILPRVLRIEPEEKVWAELFHNIYATILVRLIQTPEIKNELIAILRQATRQKTLAAYLKWAVKDLMNLLSGKQIFKIEKV